MSDSVEVRKLVDKLNLCREQYYNEGRSLISDEEFDFEERRLKELDPNNEYFRQVGRSIKNLTRDIKVEHEIPMLSMQKVQNAEDAVAWLNDLLHKVPGLYFDKSNPDGTALWVDPKLDGISGKLVYDSKGVFSYASTRGDGKVGAKIPFALGNINGIPHNFYPNCELRGEFIINKKYSKIFSGPLRNACNGILKRKDSTEDLKYITFVIYDFHAYNPKNDIIFKDRADKLKQIEQILSDWEEKFYIIPIEKTNSIPEIYTKYVTKLRKEWPYETDGIILTVDGGQDNYDLINSKYMISTCNKFNMALKPPAEFASTTVTGIDIAVNRQKISFVAMTKPTFINGVEVKRATLDNYQQMRKKKIGIGSTVLLKRSNDVIPKIVDAYNDEDASIKYINPKNCPVCGTPLVKSYQDLACPNEYGCSGIFKSKVENMFGSLGVKNIGPATISGLVDYMSKEGMSFTFYELFKILLNEHGELDRFLNEFFGTPKKITIFKESVKWLFENLYQIKFLHGFNIPMIGMGELIKHNIRSIPDLASYLVKLRTKDDNLIDNAFDAILYKWSSDENHTKELKNCSHLLKTHFAVETGIPEGAITYCISGSIPDMNKSDVIKALKEINPELVFVPNVSVNTNFLISYETGTTKVLKANKYKIPVITVEEAIKKFKK